MSDASRLAVREEFAWSPDGKEIAYTAQLGDDSAWSTDLNIYIVPRQRRTQAKSITANNKATDTGPVYSPDGKTIAYRAMARPGFESDRYRIKLYDRASGKTQTLTESWDRSPGSLEWSPGRQVARGDGSRRRPPKDISHRCGQRPADGAGQGPLQQRSRVCWSASVTGRAARSSYSQDSLTAPAEIHSAEARRLSDPKRLTHFNDERMKLARISQPGEFHFTGAGGEKVQAWIFKPVGFEEGKEISGGFRHSRRAPGGDRRPFSLSLESAGVCRRGLRGDRDQLSRLDRLWAGVYRFDLAAIGAASRSRT